jgi:[acyl-carrier-protein] S-malonyltransferase
VALPGVLRSYAFNFLNDFDMTYKIEGKTKSGLAFVFPGQGSQSIGMLNAFLNADFEHGQAVHAAVIAADKALGEDLSGLIQNGPAEDLALTVNTQPAMLLAAYCAFAAWQSAGGPMPVAMAGHSLGEYTALVAAGALDLPDAISLVRLRAQAMQSAVPVGTGTMAAILGLDDDTVRAVCISAAQGEVVAPANFNAPAQVVIAGHKAAVERACEAAKVAGAKRALLLPVSAPFHSSLLEPAGAALKVALTKLIEQNKLKSPLVSVLNNIDVDSPSEPNKILDALVRQAFGPVRWVELIQKLRSQGISQIVEFGPGKVLSGLIQRIDKSIAVHSVFDPASLRTALEAIKES